MMNPASPLSLSQAVFALQSALQNQGRLAEIAPQLSAVVRSAGELSTFNLPEPTVLALSRLRDGGILEEGEAVRSLSLLAAGVGSRETATKTGPSSSAREIRSLAAVRDLMSSKSFSDKPPKAGFWARMSDPANGFEPFVTPQGTKVAFFASPEDLGGQWAKVIRGHWKNGLGLVAFLNEKSGACGMIFVHGAGKVTWSRPDRNLWYSSGGSMAFPQERFSFAEALVRVVDKGVAMTLKWRSVDETLGRVGHDTRTGLGGSKGILLHGKNGQGLARGLEVYAEILNLLGITLTGSDEGVDAGSADRLAELAPYNIVGSQRAHYRGYAPIEHTANGVFQALNSYHAKFFKDTEAAPVLLVGYGGIGSLLRKSLRRSRLLPLTGVVDVDVSRLCDLRGLEPKLGIYQDRSVMEPSAAEFVRLKWNGISSEPGLARIIERTAGTSQARILSPNGGPQPITFIVAAAMIAGGIRAAVGAANNQAAFDAAGSPDPIAWILQAGGVFHAADFAVNKLGAAAVISNAILLGYAQLRRMSLKVGDEIEDQIDLAFRRGIPPFVFERDRAARAWNVLVGSGRAKGGKFALSSG
jgi:hypothetical protein